MGFLSDLGVFLGNEDICFQDLSFKFYFLGQKGGVVFVFGMLGKSSNDFMQFMDIIEWESEKDFYNVIDFDFEMVMVGFSWLQL